MIRKNFFYLINVIHIHTIFIIDMGISPCKTSMFKKSSFLGLLSGGRQVGCNH